MTAELAFARCKLRRHFQPPHETGRGGCSPRPFHRAADWRCFGSAFSLQHGTHRIAAGSRHAQAADASAGPGRNQAVSDDVLLESSQGIDLFPDSDTQSHVIVAKTGKSEGSVTERGPEMKSAVRMAGRRLCLVLRVAIRRRQRPCDDAGSRQPDQSRRSALPNWPVPARRQQWSCRK